MYYIPKDSVEVFQSFKKFARDKILPSVQERDKTEYWDKTIWEGLSEIGALGALIPEEYGGQGATCLQAVLMTEALAVGSADGGLILATNVQMVIGTVPIIIFGTEEQKKKYLPKIASGKYITSFGLTEASSGSDAASMLTTAKLDGDHYILNGSKMFITNGPIADLVIVTARTDKKQSRSAFGISTFILETKLEGFSSGKPLEKMGMNSSKTSELIFDNMKVPKENLLGELHYGFSRVIHTNLEWERVILMANGLGSTTYVLETCFRYSLERKQFGQSIINFYAIYSKLVMLWCMSTAARRYLYAVAILKDKGHKILFQASIAKLFITDYGEGCFRDGIQILGGWGYMKEYDVERIYRDARLGTIGGGTNTVMQMIIASSIRNYGSFCAGLELFEESKNECLMKEKYPTSISRELEALLCLRSLVESAYKQIKTIRKSQETMISFSNVICMYSILQHSYWDCAVDTENYTSAHKKRDFFLLLNYMINQNLHSIQSLSFVDEKNASDLLDNMLKMKNIDENMKTTMDFLRNQYFV